MGLSTALFTGVSGLSINGTGLSIVGDNIANTNTTGFKASRASFGDILSSSMGGGSSFQIGRGANLQAVQAQFTQGTLETTSNPLDLAIEGDGFFIVKDVNGAQFYTRAGAFKLNKEGDIVNPEGNVIQGYLTQQGGVLGSINVSSLNSAPLQSSEITVSANLTSATTTKDPTNDSQNVFTINSANSTIKYNNGVGDVTVTLDPGDYSGNGLASELAGELGAGFAVTYNGQTHEFEIVNTTGSTINFLWGDGTTTAEQILGFASANVSVANNGTLTSDYAAVGFNPADASNTSDFSTSITVFDSLGNSHLMSIYFRKTAESDLYDVDSTNNTIVFEYPIATTRTATIAAGHYSSAEMAAEIQTALEAALPAVAMDFTVTYDPSSRGFTILNDCGAPVDFLWENASTTAESLLGFTAIGHGNVADGGTAVSDNASGGEGNRWHWYAVVPSADSTTGQLQVGAVGTIEFDTGGKLVQYTQGYNSFNFDGGVTQLQQISLDFANGGSGTLAGGSGLTGTTQFGTASSVLFQSQDGYTAGSLQSLIVNQNGSMTGVFTNGQTMKVADVALARFIAPTELTKAGRNLYTESNGSGVAIIGTAGTSGRGRMFANSLEASNVDIAEEFVKMIAMQRGFQGNTKVISAADELLTELGNIKR